MRGRRLCASACLAWARNSGKQRDRFAIVMWTSETTAGAVAGGRIGVASDAAKWRGLLHQIVRAQFKLKDQSTLLGFGWSFLNPLLMLGCLFLFFNGQIGRGIDHYAIYLLIGLVHFTHFSNSTGSAMTVLAVMSRLTCDAIFPKELLVVGAVVASSIEFAISMGLCAIIAALTGVPMRPLMLLLPAVV